MADISEHAQEGECEHVGEPMPDIAGTGILLAFITQAFLSLVLALWVLVLSRHRRLDLRHEPGTAEHEIELKRLETAIDILMVGNDIQMLTGLALMITAFVAERTSGLSLYHLHLIFDTVSFVGVSNAAALVTWTFCASKHPDASKYAMKTRKTIFGRTRYVTARHRTTYLFALVFLALSILLLVRLERDWSTAPDAKHGSCFRAAGLLAAPAAAHPGVDKTYVGVTAAWLLADMLLAVFFGPPRRYFILAAAAAQFPVHLYAVAALRTGNQAFLAHEGGETENSWDFGQTTAVLLLIVTLNEFGTKIAEAWRFERGVRRAEKARRREAEAATAPAPAVPGGQAVGGDAEKGLVTANPEPARNGDTAAKQAAAVETSNV